jgi:hypothetical protein
VRRVRRVAAPGRADRRRVLLAEAFTGTEGQYVPIAETIRGFKEIIEIQHDDVPESAFFLKGTIDDVVKAASGKKDDDKADAKDAKADDAKDNDNGDDESDE